jgi:competence protein ComEC
MSQKTSRDYTVPERYIIARIYRIDELEEAPRSKVSIEFDGIDEHTLHECEGAQDYQELLESRDHVNPFGLLRLEVNREEFKSVSGVEPSVGYWFRIELSSRRDGRWEVEYAPLTIEGYRVSNYGFIHDITPEGEDSDLPLLPLGAAVTKKKKSVQMAINGGVFPRNAILSRSFRSCPCFEQPIEILVRDVGQASFNTLFGQNESPIMHFDAGWRVSFNAHTSPAVSTVKDLDDPVILSHWDWDHLHGYYVLPALQKVPWVTPVQHLGPGASRVAAQLNASGLLAGLAAGRIYLRWGMLAVCAGPAGNKNQTGLVMRVKLTSSTSALLTGDADYDFALKAFGSTSYSSLIITHHGAKFGGHVPSPSGKAHAVVSYGENNTYNHPNSGAIASHSSAHWIIHRTTNYGGIPTQRFA